MKNYPMLPIHQLNSRYLFQPEPVDRVVVHPLVACMCSWQEETIAVILPDPYLLVSFLSPSRHHPWQHNHVYWPRCVVGPLLFPHPARRIDAIIELLMQHPKLDSFKATPPVPSPGAGPLVQRRCDVAPVHCRGPMDVEHVIDHLLNKAL